MPGSVPELTHSYTEPQLPTVQLRMLIPTLEDHKEKLASAWELLPPRHSPVPDGLEPKCSVAPLLATLRTRGLAMLWRQTWGMLPGTSSRKDLLAYQGMATMKVSFKAPLPSR